MNFQEYIWEIIAATILIPLIALVARKLWALAQSSVLSIELKVPDGTTPNGVQFGVLHVRDGTDQQVDKGPIRNREIRFRKRSSDVLLAEVRHVRRLGCQYKGFVDHEGIPFDQISGTLEGLGFHNVKVGEGKPFRAWFLLPDYRVI